MAHYKVHYFDYTGLGEPIRMLLSYGGIDFEDVRIKFEDWPKIKPKMPLRQVPVLEIDGHFIHHSSAIYRYLAVKANVNGKDEVENVQIDMLVETIHDFMKKITDWYYEKDDARKNAMEKGLFEESIPLYLENLEGNAKIHGGYIALDRLTWADFLLISVHEFVSNLLNKDIFADYPNLIKLRKNFLEIPSIKAWIKKRPSHPTLTFDLKSFV